MVTVVDHYELTLAGLANSLLIPTLEGGFLDVVVTYIDRGLFYLFYHNLRLIKVI